MPVRFRDKLKNAGRQTGKCLKTTAWQTCKCLLWTICSPCVCCLIIFLPGRSEVRQRSRKAEPVRPMLPWPRRRALSITSTDLQKSQITRPQNQSTFMTKLPLEIRRMIYEEALREDTIHLSLLQGQLNARRCSVHCCSCYISPLRKEKTLDIAVPLLRTCRRIYSEAVETLYKSNHLFISTDSEDYPTTGYLSYFFLPQRMAQISDLSIQWNVDYRQFSQTNLMRERHRCEWFRSWEALSRLTGLRRLHIKLYFGLDLWQHYCSIFWIQNSGELLEPIKKITAPRDFVITLPHRRCFTDIDVGNSRCVFKLPERDSSDTEDDSI